MTYQKIGFHLLLLCVVTMTGLVACTAEHTVQSTERYSRKLGVANQYDIERWHNRVIARESSILVVVSSRTDLDTALLQRAVVESFGSGFSHVDSLGPAITSRSKALREAHKQQFGFLLDVQRVETKLVASREQDVTDESTANAGTHYSKVMVEMVLIDVISGRTIDKFSVVARPAYIKLFGDDLQALLSKPLAELVDDLTGV